MNALHRMAIVAGLSLLLCPISWLSARGQESRHMELGADFNYVHTNAPPGGCGCFAMNGADAWFGYELKHSAHVVGMFSAQHASDVDGSGADLTITTYLLGGRYSWQKLGRWSPFGQVLLGGAHAGGSFAPQNTGYGGSNAFAMIAGGGLDIRLSDRFALRAFEADYYHTRFANGVNDHQNNLRISAGLIVRFGQK